MKYGWPVLIFLELAGADDPLRMSYVIACPIVGVIARVHLGADGERMYDGTSSPTP